jgi:hypothetical protein
MLVIFAADRQAPHRRDVVFRCVCVVANDDIRGIKEGRNIEQRTVGGDCDSPSSLVVSSTRHVEISFRSDKPVNIKAVLLYCLLNHLIDELARRAKKNNALPVLPSKPLAYQKTDKRLPASRR